MPDNFPFFSGVYADFDVEWYRVVGSTIALTMILNVFTPHIGAFGLKCMKNCIICLDQGCGCNSKKTKKILQEDYEAVYTGTNFVLELRYSQIISNFYITMLYSSGMPLLYPVAFIAAVLTYWVDKFFFLKVYRSPPRHDITLAQKSRNMMVWAMPLHFLFGWYMYTNSSILTTY